MQTVTIEEAKMRLAELIDSAVHGEPFLITDLPGNAPIQIEAKPAAGQAETQPSGQVDTNRRLGFMKGEFTIPDDFDTLMQDEIIELFEGRPDKFKDFEDYTRTKKA